MKSWVWTSLVVVGLHASAADAQLRVVVSDGELTSLGTLEFPRRPSIDDNGAIAFRADHAEQLTTLLARWRDGAFSKIAEHGDPSPCGGTIDTFQESEIPLRPQWSVIHTLEAGVHRSLGWNGSALTCLASFPSLTQRTAWPVTNLAGESLSGEAWPYPGGLYLVAPSGGTVTPVVGNGATVPTPPMATIQGTETWALDDDGDVTAAVVSTGGEFVGSYVVHGRPGSLTMLVPSGIGGNDTWNAGSFDVNRDGIVAYFASVTPEADPLAGYNAIWLGAPGSETKVVQFPAMTTSGVEITHLVTSEHALHVVGGSHLVMHAEYGNIEGTAVVRWNSGTLEVIARSGTELRGHPGVMVHGFGGIGVDATGTVYFTVFTNSTLSVSGVYRVAVGGDIEKILAPGDVLQIQGVDETIDAAYFTTSRGAGHATAVSPTGKIVFSASYRGFTKQALVTLGAAPLGPPPNLKLERVAERTTFHQSIGLEVNEVVIRITNHGEGPANPVVLTGSPQYLGCYGQNPQELDDEALNSSMGCVLPEIPKGGTIDRVAVFSTSLDGYEYTLEVFADRDVDQLDNRITGMILPYNPDSGCTVGPRSGPLGAVPLLASLGWLLRRRRKR